MFGYLQFSFQFSASTMKKLWQFISLLTVLIALKRWHDFPLDLAQYFRDEMQQKFCNRSENVCGHPEASMTAADIINYRGYPCEIHHVVTEDGYILELVRIPALKLHNSSSEHKAIYLQHGLLASAHVWLLAPNNSSLAYILADNGYDVWLGNSRGNIYSRKHKFLYPNQAEFWNFSMHELGHYDIPASIAYVLGVTQQRKLIYIGHSLGCTIFHIAMIQHPQLNDKIDFMIGLAPTASVAHLNNWLKYLTPFMSSFRFLLGVVGNRPIFTNDNIVHKTLRFLVENTALGANFGRRFLFATYGFSQDFQDEIGLIKVAHYPSGGSFGTMEHFLQNYQSGEKFSKYDYGAEGNLEHYGTRHAGEYNLSLVTAPVYNFWTDCDILAPPEDIQWLNSKLSNLRASIRVEDTLFSHGDFLWSPRAKELVHVPILSIIKHDFNLTN